MCQGAPPVELTVALDATLWDEPTTGIGRYGHEVAGALQARGVRVLRVGARRSGELPRRMRSRTLHTIAELPRVLPKSGASLFHAVGNVDLPLLRVPGMPFVLTVHDLIPLTSPRTVSRAFHWQFRLWLSRSLRVADHVVCVSEWTRSRRPGSGASVFPSAGSCSPVRSTHARTSSSCSRLWSGSDGRLRRW